MAGQHPDDGDDDENMAGQHPDDDENDAKSRLLNGRIHNDDIGDNNNFPFLKTFAAIWIRMEFTRMVYLMQSLQRSSTLHFGL